MGLTMSRTQSHPRQALIQGRSRRHPRPSVILFFLDPSTERLSNAAMSRSSVPTEATGFDLDSVCLRQSDAIDWTADGFTPNTDEHDYSALNSLCNISQAAWNTPLQGYTSFLYDETTVNAGWPGAHVPVACHSQAFTTESQQYENEGEADSRYRRYDGW